MCHVLNVNQMFWLTFGAIDLFIHPHVKVTLIKSVLLIPVGNFSLVLPKVIPSEV
jgi:hypothetical protein